MEGGAFYDIWLASYRDSSAVRERTVGVWSTSNTTDSPASQIIDNRPGRNPATFVEGYNHVVFRYVKADPSGRIEFDGNGADPGEGFDNDYRLGLSGSQIAPGTTRESLEITDLAYDRDRNEITPSWKSNPGESHGIYGSENLGEFVPGPGPGISPEMPAHPSDTTTTYGPFSDPMQYPGFAGTVKTVDTRPFWRESAVSPNGRGFRWNQNGENDDLIGDAMGENMLELLTP